MHLASVTHHWGRYYIRRARAVLEGRWETGNTWSGLAADFVRLEPIAKRVPAAVRRQIRKAESGIIEGKLLPFGGPLRANDGRLMLEEGFLTDGVLQQMDWLVEGVIGKVR